MPLNRRDAALVLAAGLGAACAPARLGARVATDQGGGPDDLVFYDLGGAVTALAGGTEGAPLRAPGGVASPDWTRLVSATVAGEITRLDLLDAQSGLSLGRTEVAGRYGARVASAGAGVVALVELSAQRSAPPPGEKPWPAGGRERTSLVLADPAGRRPSQTISLDGNYEPEAFSVSGQQVFVLQHLPPLAPDRYRVRTLDLARGTVGPMLTRDKVPVAAEEEMRGQGRMHVLAPRLDTLYTLYTQQNDHVHSRGMPAAGGTGRPDPHVHAFVHVLNLEVGWAYCLDLPMPFGIGGAERHALAVSPDGRQLYVWDAASGHLAGADASTLEIKRVESPAPEGPPAGPRAAIQAGPDGRLYLASESQIRVADATTLAPRATWSLPTPVHDLALSRDGGRLYAALADAVAVLDAATGKVIRRVAAPGIAGLLHVAPRSRRRSP